MIMLKDTTPDRRWDFRGVASYTQKHKCVHIWTKHMGRFNHSSDGLLVVCVQKRVRILSKSNFDRICDDVLVLPTHRIYHQFRAVTGNTSNIKIFSFFCIQLVLCKDCQFMK